MSDMTRRQMVSVTARAAVAVSVGACSGDTPMEEDPPDDPPVTPSLNGGPLPIPALLQGPTVDLTMQAGTREFLSGVQTNTLGYNGSYLGPTLRFRQGDAATLNVTNQLAADTTTHWHGLHVPPAMDGGPHQRIEPGETWSASYTIRNRASTYWYHPHPHTGQAQDNDGTGGQVYRGLAGLLIVDDAESDAAALPREYGVDDIPLIIQDRCFATDGSLIHFPLLPINGAVLRKGDQFLVNGEITPTHDTPGQMIRFRILNASNARIYNLGFEDDRPFHVIASDGGLLEAPVQVTRVLLSPSERAEIVVDFSGDEVGSLPKLISHNTELSTLFVPTSLADDFDRTDFPVMEFRVVAPTAGAVTSLPASLSTIARIPGGNAVNEATPRVFQIEDADNGDGTGMQINGVSMDINRIDQTVTRGDTEIWEITNVSTQAHPFHVHGDSFQILTRNGNPPAAHEMGWKDSVLVRPGEIVHIIKPFDDYSDPVLPFMFHCHILEHEDAGMMGQFIVVEP